MAAWFQDTHVPLKTKSIMAAHRLISDIKSKYYSPL